MEEGRAGMSRILSAVLATAFFVAGGTAASAAECVVENASRLPINVTVTLDGSESIPVSIPAQRYRHRFPCAARESGTLAIESFGAPGTEACVLDVADLGGRVVVFSAPVQKMPYATFACSVR